MMRLKQRGLSLLEILVSSALSLFVILILMKVYLNLKQNTHFTEGFTRLLEHAQVATWFLTHDIRMAGSGMCRPLNNLKINGRDTQTIHGYTMSSATAALSAQWLPEEIRNHSDVIMVSYMGKAAAVLSVNGQQLRVHAHPKLSDKQTLVLGNCQTQKLLPINRIVRSSSQQILNLNHAIKFDDKGSSLVGEYHQYAYYVADSKRRNQHGQIIYALYRKDLAGPATVASELVPGVEDMHVLYGLKQKLGVVYLKADQITDWQKVVSVDIELLLSSIDPILHRAVSVNYNHKALQFDDGQLRKPWHMYVSLRSRQ